MARTGPAALPAGVADRSFQLPCAEEVSTFLRARLPVGVKNAPTERLSTASIRACASLRTLMRSAQERHGRLSPDHWLLVTPSR